MTASSLNAYAIEDGDEYENKPTNVDSQVFVDVPKTHWSYQYICDMVDRGIIDGYVNGNYCPENNVTRAEFAKILSFVYMDKYELQWDQIYDYLSDPSTYFKDVNGSEWYAPYVALVAHDEAYMNSFYDKFKPNEYITRKDATIALSKFSGDTALEYTGGVEVKLKYNQDISENIDNQLADIETRLMLIPDNTIRISKNLEEQSITITSINPTNVDEIINLCTTKGSFAITDINNNILIDSYDINSAQSLYGKTHEGGANESYLQLSIKPGKLEEVTRNILLNSNETKGIINIVINDEVLSSVKVAEVIDSDTLILSGIQDFNLDLLSIFINSGELPYIPDDIEYKTYEPNPDLLRNMFSDVESLSDEDKEYIYKAVRNGFIDGFEDGTFRSNEYITRAEIAAIFSRAYNYWG